MCTLPLSLWGVISETPLLCPSLNYWVEGDSKPEAVELVMQFKEEEQENNMVVRQDRTLKVLNRTNNCLSRKIPPRSPWGHYLVGLKGGAPSTSRAPDIPVFKCLYCVYTTDRQSKLTRHTVGCKKKQRNKVRSSSIPREKQVLTQNLNSGDTREFVEF